MTFGRTRCSAVRHRLRDTTVTLGKRWSMENVPCYISSSTRMENDISMAMSVQ